MTTLPPHVATFDDVDADQFEQEIRPLNRPVVMRGLVRNWPIVRQAQAGPESIAGYLSALASGADAKVLVGGPQIRGAFFYNARLDGFNFKSFPQTAGFLLDWLVDHAARDAAAGECEAAVAQALVAPEHFPGFAEAHPMPLLRAAPAPRLWIGNAARTQTHYDTQLNIACNVSGRRRFTLFPPHCLPMLYPGPFDLTIGGTPISLVDIEEPDLVTFPRFAEAWAQAEIADLEPGDALYIPYMWWHHVRATGPLNVLVNYWWNPADPALISPYLPFYAALGALRGLPADQRAAWAGLFDYYVFGREGDALAHIPPPARGILAEHSGEDLERFKAFVRDGLGAF
jgi:hypothetical protein